MVDLSGYLKVIFDFFRTQFPLYNGNSNVLPFPA